MRQTRWLEQCMKIYKNLYPRICDFSNLCRACRAARKGKRARPAAASFETYHRMEFGV